MITKRNLAALMNHHGEILRRQFAKTLTAVAAAAIALGLTLTGTESVPSGGRSGLESRAAAVSFVDEGVKKVLNCFKKKE